MKIAFVIPSLSNNGPNVFTHNLVSGLLEVGIESTVYYIDDRIELDFPVRVRRLRLSNILELRNFDVVHTTMLKPDLYMAFFSLFFNVKIVTGCHNFYKEDLLFNYNIYYAKFLYFLWSWSFSRISRLIFSSHEMQIYYRDKILSLQNDCIIPYGIPVPIVDEDIPNELEMQINSLKQRGFVIVGSCGLLIKRKGFDLLIQSLSMDRRIALVLVGGGDQYSNLKSLALTLGVSDRVVFCGQQKKSARFYKYFDIFAMSSYSEGFGIAMLEALSLGLPLVCSELPIYKPFFNPSKIAFFKTGDVESLHDSLSYAINNRELLSVGSTDIFNTYFTLNHMVHKHIQFYKSIIN